MPKRKISLNRSKSIKQKKQDASPELTTKNHKNCSQFSNEESVYNSNGSDSEVLYENSDSDSDDSSLKLDVENYIKKLNFEKFNDTEVCSFNEKLEVSSENDNINDHKSESLKNRKNKKLKNKKSKTEVKEPYHSETKVTKSYDQSYSNKKNLESKNSSEKSSSANKGLDSDFILQNKINKSKPSNSKFDVNELKAILKSDSGQDAVKTCTSKLQKINKGKIHILNEKKDAELIQAKSISLTEPLIAKSKNIESLRNRKNKKPKDEKSKTKVKEPYHSETKVTKSYDQSYSSKKNFESKNSTEKLSSANKGLDSYLILQNKINKSRPSNSKYDVKELKTILKSDSGLDTVKTCTPKLQKINNGKIHILNEKKGAELIQAKNISLTEPLIAKSKNISESNNEMKILLNKDVSKNKETCQNINEKEFFKEKLKAQLQSASFRLLNQRLYTASGSDSYKMFHNDPDAFKIYHEGYNMQISQWPVNPISIIISWLRKKPKNWIVADFGCGDGKLSKSIKQKTISLDLVRSEPGVIECDMAHTPLESHSVNVVVFCLSLMGTNLTDFILEANRVLEYSGLLKIAEVESRFEDVGIFLKGMFKLGFRCIHRDDKRKYFWMFDFLKIRDVKQTTNKILTLRPCMYKNR